VDERILTLRGAGFETVQDTEAFAVEARGIDAFAGGEIGGELVQSLAQLPDGAGDIAAFAVMEGDGEVDQRLKKEAAGAALRRPQFLPDFVAFEVLAVVEEMDAARQQLVPVHQAP
jgi:hypothetical protein